MYIVRFAKAAAEDLEKLKNNSSKKATFKAVAKALALMETNLRHPSLNTHEFKSLKGPHGEKVFEAYAQQNTPSAYRILWYYGSHKTICIIAIIPHPKN